MAINVNKTNNPHIILRILTIFSKVFRGPGNENRRRMKENFFSNLPERSETSGQNDPTDGISIYRNFRLVYYSALWRPKEGTKKPRIIIPRVGFHRICIFS